MSVDPRQTSEIRSVVPRINLKPARDPAIPAATPRGRCTGGKQRSKLCGCHLFILIALFSAGCVATVVVWNQVNSSARTAAIDALEYDAIRVSRAIEQVVHELETLTAALSDVLTADAPYIRMRALRSSAAEMFQRAAYIHVTDMEIAVAPIVWDIDRHAWEDALSNASVSNGGSPVVFQNASGQLVSVHSQDVYAPCIMSAAVNMTTRLSTEGFAMDLMQDSPVGDAILAAINTTNFTLTAPYMDGLGGATLLSLVLPVVVPTARMNSSLAFLSPQGAAQPPRPGTWAGITASQGFDLAPMSMVPEPVSVVAVSCLTIAANTVLQAATSLYSSTKVEGMIWEDVTDVAVNGECAGNVRKEASDGWRTDNHLGERIVTIGSRPIGGTTISGLRKYSSGLQVSSASAFTAYASSASSSDAAIVTHTLMAGDRCYAMTHFSSSDYLSTDALNTWWILVAGMLASTLPPIAIYYAIANIQARKDAELAAVQVRLSTLTAAHEAHLRTLAWVGHHLRNPAHVIASAAALIKDSLPRHSRSREDVETIRRSSDDINRILSDVTNYAALQEGNLEIRPSVWEIRGAIRQLIATHRGTARVPVTTEIAHDVPRVSISDPLRVQQILSIGLANAVQSTPTGFIHLRVFMSTLSLEQICNDTDGHASITIAPDSATRENNSGRNTGTSARVSPRTSPRPSPQLSPRPRSQEPSPPLGDDTLSVPIPSSLTDSSFSGSLIFQIADTGSGWQHTSDMLVQAFGTGIGADGTVTPTSSRIRSPAARTRTSTLDSLSKYTHDAPPSGHRGTGLGLPVARGLAASLGGDCIVTFSASTNVTVFAFSIPLVSAQAHDILRLRRPLTADTMLQEAFLNAPIECRSKEWTVADLTYAIVSENSTTSLIPESPFRSPVLREFDSFVETAESGETPIASLSAFRILYADDDAMNRRLFSRLAAKLRVHCDVVDDGDRVLPAIEARGQALGLPNYTEATVCPYPIIFLDIVMARMDGITTCGEVRRRYGGSVRIVAATGNAHEVDVLLERGFDHVLTKPFTLSEIEEQVKLCHDAIQMGGSSGSVIVGSPAAGSGLLIQPLHKPRRLVAHGAP